MKFTTDSVAKLKKPAGKDEHFEWDDDMPGFGIRFRGDRATWVVGWRINGRQRRESIGDIRKVTLASAKKAAQNRWAQVKLGVDPAAKKEKAKEEAAKDKITFGYVASEYINHKKASVRPATLGMLTYDLMKMCKPIHNRPMDSLVRFDVADLIKKIVKESGLRSRTRHIQGEERAGRIMGERVRGHMSGMFKWAMGEGYLETNPVIGTNNPGEGIGSRNRVLTDDELRVIWHNANVGDSGKIVRLLILTGCRRCEISNLRWDEIDMEARTMTLEGERTKNGETLRLTLPPMAMEILKSMEGVNPVYVFGDGNKPFTNWSYSITSLHTRIAESGYILKRWTLHDLRRTMRTGMGRLGVPPHIAERVINHVQSEIIRTYDQYDYAKEIEAALLVWEQHVREVIELQVGKRVTGGMKLIEGVRLS